MLAYSLVERCERRMFAEQLSIGRDGVTGVEIKQSGVSSHPVVERFDLHGFATAAAAAGIPLDAHSFLFGH